MKQRFLVCIGTFLLCITLGVTNGWADSMPANPGQSPVFGPASDVNCAGCVNTADIAAEAVTAAKIDDGEGSGLNADLFDGFESSEFVKKGEGTYANVIVVAKSGGDFDSIQDAIDSINPSASEPSLIQVMPGTYEGKVRMKSYVHLQGSGREVTTITCGSYCVLFSSLSHAEISGFTITTTSGGSAVSIASSDNITITDNKVVGSADRGIYVFYSRNTIIISDNVISGNGGYGIFVYYYSDPKISGNTIQGNGYGIVASVGSRPVVTYNRIVGNGGRDITLTSQTLAELSFNIFNTSQGTFSGNYNTGGVAW